MKHLDYRSTINYFIEDFDNYKSEEEEKIVKENKKFMEEFS